MRTVHVSAEFAPIIKAGGLADVVHGLSSELVRQGHEVRVFLPFYSFVQKKLATKMQKQKLVIYEKNQWHNVSIHMEKLDNISLVFFEMHHQKAYFSRENIYGYEDDAQRFIFFCVACMEFLSQEKKEIDILHLHDWHTSLCAPIVKDKRKLQMKHIKSVVLTVHNFHYQGICSTDDIKNVQLDAQKYLSPHKMQDPSSGTPLLNLLKGGITYCDAFTTVSPTYAQELLQNKHTYGLEKEIHTHKNKLHGILNGLDSTHWNPKKDLSLQKNYAKEETPEKVYLAKLENKVALLKDISIKDPHKPLFIFIGRLVVQKGIDVLEDVIEYIVKKGGNFILCGSSSHLETLETFSQLEKKEHFKDRIHIHLHHNESLVRRMYASSDFIVVPSLFEPCGLVQLIAMRYGTIPIVRKTGGLNDSVQDIALDPSKGNGFVFEAFLKESIFSAIDKACNIFTHGELKKIFFQIMQLNYSWEKPAIAFTELYQSLIKKEKRL